MLLAPVSLQSRFEGCHSCTVHRGAVWVWDNGEKSLVFFYTRYLLFVRQNLFVRAVPLSCRLPLLLSACSGSCVAAVTRTGTVSSADVFFSLSLHCLVLCELSCRSKQAVTRRMRRLVILWLMLVTFSAKSVSHSIDYKGGNVLTFCHRIIIY